MTGTIIEHENRSPLERVEGAVNPVERMCQARRYLYRFERDYSVPFSAR